MPHKLSPYVWLYTACYSLMLSGTSMLVLIAGIIGSDIAPSASLATLPIALAIVGLALNTLPASFLMSRFGRKTIFLLYAIVGICSALLAAYAMVINSFLVFCLASLGVGAGAAAVQQYRFAAMEMVATDAIPRAASTILLGGIVAAILGPELSLLGKNLFEYDYMGSFLLLAVVYSLGFCLLLFTPNRTLVQPTDDRPGRSLTTLFKQPTLIIAVLAAAVGYGVMSFIMTATPLSMHNHFGHSLTDTKWVIQSHVAAMYLPSLISGFLIERFGYLKMMVAGLVAFALCLIIAFSGQSFSAFWAALILLGIGWNFLFVSGTALLPQTYQPNEKFKVQAFNDFLIFGTQAVAALSSGWALMQYQWQGLLLLSVIPILIIVAVLFVQASNRRLLRNTEAQAQSSRS